MNKEETYVIQRQVPQIGAKPFIHYMKVDQEADVVWVDDHKSATKFTRNVAGAVAYSLRQEYEQTNVGPSYWAVEV